MSSFFQKVMGGAAKAADKAQQALEIQRLNLRIFNAKKEIEKVKIQIGHVTLQAYKRGYLSERDAVVSELCGLIIRHEGAIAEIEQKLQEIKSGNPYMGGS